MLEQVANLCMKKGAELDDGDSEKKMKGRAVFLGDNVKDQDHNFAIFEELRGAHRRRWRRVVRWTQ